MSKDADKDVFGVGRLWGGGDTLEREPPAREKVLPLKTPPDERPDADYDSRAYLAFETRDNADSRLEIVRNAGPSRMPNYTYLLDISYDRHQDSAFALIYTFMVVQIAGEHLRAIVRAIRLGNCVSIRQYDPKFHDPPAPGEPVIYTVEITTADEKLTKPAS